MTTLAPIRILDRDFIPDEGGHEPPNGTAEACIEYGGYINPGGYGRRGHVLVHREALEARLGRTLAPGMDACHTCDNRRCVNPDHLYEGTRRQNMADATARGRHNKRRGEVNQRAKLTADDVRQIRQLAISTRYSAIGDRFGVHPSTISRIARGLWRTEVSA